MGTAMYAFTEKTEVVPLPDPQVMLNIRKKHCISFENQTFSKVITKGIAASSWYRWYLGC